MSSDYIIVWKVYNKSNVPKMTIINTYSDVSDIKIVQKELTTMAIRHIDTVKEVAGTTQHMVPFDDRIVIYDQDNTVIGEYRIFRISDPFSPC